MKVKALKAAFPRTLPILTGYLFLGGAYGLLMRLNGFGILWTFLCSVLIFAGSIQYVGIAFLTSAFNPLYTLLITIIINARYLFYGISMIPRYKGTGKLKPFLIFALVDETFSINCTNYIPKEIDKKWFYFFVSLINYMYWVVFSVLGNALGNYITFNTKGIEFVLTALFVVIFLNQWQDKQGNKPALIGLFCTVCCLIIFGSSNFVIPSLIAIFTVLVLSKKHLSAKEEQSLE